MEGPPNLNHVKQRIGSRSRSGFAARVFLGGR